MYLIESHWHFWYIHTKLAPLLATYIANVCGSLIPFVASVNSNVKVQKKEYKHITSTWWWWWWCEHITCTHTHKHTYTCSSQNVWLGRSIEATNWNIERETHYRRRVNEQNGRKRERARMNERANDQNNKGTIGVSTLRTVSVMLWPSQRVNV